MQHKRTSKILSLLLAASMVLTLLPATALAADASNHWAKDYIQDAKDLTGHWAEAAIVKCHTYGIMNGDGNGTFRPNDPITVAEFCTMVNAAFGFTKTEGAKTFTDVPPDAWYATQIPIASAMGYMNGNGDGTTAPETNISRERAFTILARVYKLTGSEAGITGFADDAEISAWARAAVSGLADAGYVAGSGGKVSPKASISRGETAQVLCNLFGDIADKDADSGTYKNLTIRKADVTIKNAVITGDLYITEGVGSGDVTLENVTVKGRTYVAGGGENSVTFTGCTLNAVVLGGTSNTHLHFVNTILNTLLLTASGSVTRGDVIVSFDAATGKMTLGGSIDKAVVNDDGTVTLTIGGIVYNAVPGGGAPVTELALSSGAVVKEMIVNNPMKLTGSGQVEKMAVHSPGVEIAHTDIIPPASIAADKDLPLTIDGAAYTGTGTGTAPVTLPSGGGGGGGYTPPIQTNMAGDGSTQSPYQVTTPAQLAQIGTGSYGLDQHYKLMDSLTVANWVPIASGSSVAAEFTGSFDGNGNTVTISSITTGAVDLDSSDYEYIGLFGYIGNGGSVENLTVAGTVSRGGMENKDVGGIAGANKGVITDCAVTATVTASGGTIGSTGGVVGASSNRVQNCYATGDVEGTDNVGGVVGNNSGTVANCYATGDVTGIDFYIGGVVGWNRAFSTVQNCYATGDVAGATEVGGVVGFNSGTVQNCYAKGNVEGETRVGGAVGHNSSNGAVQNCYATGNAEGNNAVGGAVGHNSSSGTVENCYATGNVEGETRVGGVVGINVGTVQNCYAIGNVKGTGADSVGGVVGLNDSGTVKNCYAMGDVEGYNNVGGVVGYNNDTGTVQSCYATGDVEGKDYVGGVVGWNFDSTVENCVALCDSVTATNSTTYVGRVMGTHDNPFYVGTLSNNYGRAGMTVTADSGNKSLVKGHDKVDGADLSDADALAPTWWENTLAWDFTTDTGDWKFGTNHPLPILEWQNNDFSAVLGRGTAASPYQITNAAQLAQIGTGDYGLDKHYILMNNITMTGDNFTPIGNNTTRFIGSFDGGGHTITGLTVDIGASVYAGLFGYVGSGGVVKNVGLIGGSVNGAGYVGGVAGGNNGTVENCYATGGVTGTGNSVGGVVGVNGTGGIVQNCYAMGDVSAGQSRAGGVVGWNSSGTVQNCYATGNVEGTESVGGVVGENQYGTVKNCYATGGVTGTGNSVGGVVGNNFGSSSTVENCYATGDVEGANNVGGMAGFNSGMVQNCYATGDVEGLDSVGGVAGNNSNGSTVQNCAALCASVTATNNTTDVGRVVGKNSNGTLANNYGRTGMTVNVTPPTSLDIGGDKVDGADVGSGDFNTQNWWTMNMGSWDWTDVWKWDGTNDLPILKWQQ